METDTVTDSLQTQLSAASLVAGLGTGRTRQPLTGVCGSGSVRHDRGK